MKYSLYHCLFIRGIRVKVKKIHQHKLLNASKLKCAQKSTKLFNYTRFIFIFNIYDQDKLAITCVFVDKI